MVKSTVLNTNRWLSPDTIVPDPANPQSCNRYSYVNNRPTAFTDPTGHAYDAFGADSASPSCNDGASLEHCIYPENYPDQSKVGWVIPNASLEADWEENRHAAANAAGMIPYVDTGEDIATFLTGCGYACQAGYEEPVGWGWRTVAGAGIFLPFGVRSIRTIGDVLGSVDQYADEALSFITSSDRLILFRGLRPNDPRLADYLQTGIVYPIGGSSSLYDHVQDGFTDSIYTSWTVDVGLAYERAIDDAGNFGAILMVDNSLIPNAQFASFRWSQYADEWEITTEGPIWDWVRIFDSSPSQ